MLNLNVDDLEKKYNKEIEKLSNPKKEACDVINNLILRINNTSCKNIYFKLSDTHASVIVSHAIPDLIKALFKTSLYVALDKIYETKGDEGLVEFVEWVAIEALPKTVMDMEVEEFKF